MNNKLKNIALLSVLLFLNNFIYAKTWHITSLNWEPYSGSRLKYFGKSVKKLKNMLAKKGINLKVEFYPWLRSQKLVKTNKKFIGYFPAWPSEVKKGFIASPAIDYSSISVITLNQNILADFNIENIFKTHSIGLIKTYSYPHNIVELAKKHHINVDYAPHEKSLLNKLLLKRDAVVITDQNVLLFNAGQQNVKKIFYFKKIIKKIPLVIAFNDNSQNKKNIELLKQINT